MKTEKLFEIIEKTFGCDKVLLRSKSRKATIVEIRQFFAAYTRNELKMYLTDIGKLLNRDHSTVVNMLKNHVNLMEYDNTYYDKWMSFLLEIQKHKYLYSHDYQANKILEEIEAQKFYGAKINIIKKLLTNGSKMV